MIVRLCTGIAVVFLGLAVHAAEAAKPTVCETLSGGLRIGHATLLWSERVQGHYTAPDGRTFGGLPEFCRVVARATPSPQSNVLIEVWLPVASPEPFGRARVSFQ